MDRQEGQEENLLQLEKGFWTGVDGETRIKLPDVLFMQHYKAELQEQGLSLDLRNTGEAGRRAEIFKSCRAVSYWRNVVDHRLLRTPQKDQDKSADSID